MNPADMQPAIRDAALAKLARARSPAVAMTLTADQMPAPGVLAPDALIVAAGGMAPADWLARGWRPAFVEGAYPEPAGAKAAIDALERDWFTVKRIRHSQDSWRIRLD